MVFISVLVAEQKQRKTKSVTLARQARFYLPLTLTSILTLVTHSLFNAGLARLPSPEMYISAFAVAKSFMHMLESPIMMVRQTVTALVEDIESFRQVRGFMLKIVGSVVLLFTLVILSGAGRWILHHIMGLSGETLEATNTILHVFMFFPFFAALRNFVQGVLIKFQATPLLTVATVVRIIYVSLLVVSVNRITLLPPGILAGLMFLTAIAVEAFVLVIGSRMTLGNLSSKFDQLQKQSQDRPVTTSVFMRFFAPLMVTAFIKTLAMPVINLGLARTASPEIAIASYAVAWGLGMIVLSPLIMFHQVPLNFIDDKDPSSLIAVRNFAVLLGVLLSSALIILSFTDLGYYVLTSIIGASAQIGVLSIDVLRIMTILPLLMVAREFYWGLLMKKRMTRYLGTGKVVNLVALTISILAMTVIGPSNPAIIGIVGMVACEAAEVLYLRWSAKRHHVMHSSAQGAI